MKKKKIKPSKVKSSNNDNTLTLDNFIYYATCFFVFTLPFIFISGLKDYVNLPKSAYVQVFVLFLWVLSLIKSIKEGKIVFKKSSLLLPLSIFMVLAFLSCFYSINFYESITKFFHWFACFLFFIFISNQIKKEQVEKILFLLFLSAVLNATFGIMQALFEIQIVPQVVPPSAFFANKNMASQFLALTFPLGFYFLLKSKNNNTSLFFTLCIAIIITYLIFALTRAAWLACLFETIILTTFIFKKKYTLWNKTKTYYAIFAILFIFVMTNSKPDMQADDVVKRATSIVTFKKEDSSLIRFSVWKNTLNIIKDNFSLGVGLHNYQIISPKYNASVYEKKQIVDETHVESGQLNFVHNDFLQIITELGILGFAFFIWFGARLLYILFKTINSSKEEDINSKLLSIAIFTAILGFCVNASFSFPLYLAVPPFVLMLFVGISSIYCEQERAYFYIESKGIHFFLLVTVSIIFLFSLNFYKNRIIIEKKSLEIDKLFMKQKWSEVIYKVKETEYITFNSKKLLFYSGSSYMKLGFATKGLEDFYKLFKVRPYETNLLINMANSYLRLGNNKKAIEIYNDIIKIKPTMFKAHYNLATIYYGLKNYKHALEEFKIASKIKEDKDLMIDIALIFLREKKYQEALYYFEKSLNLRKDVIKKVNINFLKYCLKQDNYKKFFSYYISLINPESKELGSLYQDFGLFFNTIGKKQDAIKFMKQATILMPNDLNVQNNYRVISKSY